MIQCILLENEKENNVEVVSGEANGNPLQCSCLENPRDGGAWWAAVSGVAQSRTRMKRLSSSSSDYRMQWRRETLKSEMQEGSCLRWRLGVKKDKVEQWKYGWKQVER